MKNNHEHHCSEHHCHCDACSKTDAASKRACSDTSENSGSGDSCRDSDTDDPEPHSNDCNGGHDHEHHDCGCNCGHDHAHHTEAKFSKLLTILGAVLVAGAFLPFWGALAPWIMALGTLMIGYPLFLSGIKSLLTAFSFDELGLLTIAVAASLWLAALSSDPFEGVFEAATVTILFRLGEYLEARAIAKSQRDIGALTDIRPDTANLLLKNGSTQTVDAENIPLGSTILLRAGDRVPIDCRVLSGSGYVDFSAITGEAMPVWADSGSTLLSGAINSDGLLTCQTTATFENSTASRIITMVRESAEKKGAAEKLISRFARVYTPSVVAAATLLAVLPPLLGAGSFKMWLSRALVFLVASCPCALVISVPLTFFAGIGMASRHGVLIKGTRYLEALAKTDCVAMDKTGTLTYGIPVVQKMVTVENSLSENELLSIALAAESNSAHPVAKAVSAYAANQPKKPVSDYTELGGLGISLTCDGKKVLCGSSKLMDRFKIDYSRLGEANIYIAVDNKAQCAFVLSDTKRKEANQALSLLHSLGIKTVAMLTGDSDSAAKAIADSLGIDKVYSELLPQQKQQKLEELRRSHTSTLFVGDGINDAPVLAAADVGAAMGLGTDAAIESADMVLINEQLTALPTAIKIARRTVKKANQNIVFAISIKALVLVLGAFGYAAMWMAVFADVGVCILAVLNSLTLLSNKKL